MKLDNRMTTPSARQKIGDRERLLIATAEPLDATASFGHSNGWTCRIRRGHEVIGESYHMFTIAGALAEALKDMHNREAAEEDETLDDTNREGQPEFNGSFR